MQIYIHFEKSNRINQYCDNELAERIKKIINDNIKTGKLSKQLNQKKSV